jgi:CcmD family protein
MKDDERGGEVRKVLEVLEVRKVLNGRKVLKVRQHLPVASVSTRKNPGLLPLLVLLGLGTGVLAGPALAQEPPPRPLGEDFVPIDELPADERLPAAPLLIAAYAFAWLALAGYVWSIRRRLDHVERELQAARRRMGEKVPRA